MTTLENISSELWKLLWKWGVWFLVLVCVVSGRLFYEMIHNPDVRFRKLLALGGLGMSTGTVAIIWCMLSNFGIWSIIIIGIAALSSYQVIEYLVNVDADTLRGWIKGVLNNAINAISKRENNDGK